MVIKKRYHEGQGSPPPPMDESWWEAVLAEEVAQSAPGTSRGSRPPVRTTTNTQVSIIEDSPEGEPETAALDWQKATALYEQDQVVSLRVTGCNRGGLLVNGEQLQGFVPISHLIESPCPTVDVEQWLANYVEQSLDLKVIECDRERGRVVFSERAAQSSPGSRNLLLRNLNPGTCVVGIVTNITDFGIFVDLGGVEGLVHVSEISWGRVQHPAEVISLGQKVDVYVINVDPKRARVALSLKRLHPNPWETAESRYSPGQVTEAVITSIVPFGAFARLEEGLDGLIHVSEINPIDGEQRMVDCVQEGQRVTVRILHVDASKQRLGLSLKLDGEAVPL
jgi:small subunit ribosomal protein S1